MPQLDRKIPDPTLDDIAVVVAYLELAVKYAALGEIEKSNTLVSNMRITLEQRFGKAIDDKILHQLSEIAKKTTLSSPVFHRHRDS